MDVKGGGAEQDVDDEPWLVRRERAAHVDRRDLLVPGVALDVLVLEDRHPVVVTEPGGPAE